jgi:two-component system cell cycle sensor histidine kinase PleC
MRVRADNKGLKLVESFETDLPELRADERAVRQICLNVLSNAIKFTPSGGTVTLRIARTKHGGLTLSIKDTGPGIPEEEIPRVLRSFGQGSLAHQTAEGGTGLGLPITKGLTELHDGTFELKSERGYGTEVIISFPRSRVVGAPPRLNERGEEEPKEPQVPWRPSKDHHVSKGRPPRHLPCPSGLPT